MTARRDPAASRRARLSNFDARSYTPAPMVRGRRGGALRRHARGAALGALLLAGASATLASSAASGRERPPGRAGTVRSATIRRRSFSALGTYRLTVSLRARRAGPEAVTVYVTGHAARHTLAYRAHATRLRYALVVTRSTRLIVDAVSSGPPVRVTVTATLRGAPEQPAPQSVTTTTTTTTSSTTTTTTSTTTAASTAPPPPPPNPYTHLVWSE